MFVAICYEKYPNLSAESQPCRTKVIGPWTMTNMETNCQLRAVISVIYSTSVFKLRRHNQQRHSFCTHTDVISRSTKENTAAALRHVRTMLRSV